MEILLTNNCSEEELLRQIIVNTAKCNDDLDYIIKKVKNSDYKRSDIFIKQLLNKE